MSGRKLESGGSKLGCVIGVACVGAMVAGPMISERVSGRETVLCAGKEWKTESSIDRSRTDYYVAARTVLEGGELGESQTYQLKGDTAIDERMTARKTFGQWEEGTQYRVHVRGQGNAQVITKILEELGDCQ